MGFVGWLILWTCFGFINILAYAIVSMVESSDYEEFSNDFFDDYEILLIIFLTGIIGFVILIIVIITQLLDKIIFKKLFESTFIKWLKEMRKK